MREWWRLTIIIIVADYNLFDLAVLAHLAPEVLVECIEVVLQLARIHLVFGIVRWVLIEVWQQDRLAVGRFDMLPRATVTVAAGADLVVETAIYFILLCAKNTC